MGIINSTLETDSLAQSDFLSSIEFTDLLHRYHVEVFGIKSPLNAAPDDIYLLFNDQIMDLHKGQSAFKDLASMINRSSQSEALKCDQLNFVHGVFQGNAIKAICLLDAEQFFDLEPPPFFDGSELGYPMNGRVSPLESLIKLDWPLLPEFTQSALLALKAKDFKRFVENAPNSELRFFFTGLSYSLMGAQHSQDPYWQEYISVS